MEPGKSIRNILRKQKCSYCKEEGHKITNCNNINLILFGELCRHKKNYDSERGNIDFAIWLISYYLEEEDSLSIIKAYAISRCKIRLNLHIHKYLEAIINYEYNILNDIESSDYIKLPEVEELGEFYNDNDNISIELMMFILNNCNSNNYIYLYNIIYINICNSNNYINNIKPSIKGIEIIDLVNENNNSLSECGVCLQSNKRNKDMIEFDCKHKLCNRCTNKIMDMNKNLCCPYCRHNISSIKYSYGVELSFNIEK
jgi:hypothetical protein